MDLVIVKLLNAGSRLVCAAVFCASLSSQNVKRARAMLKIEVAKER